MKKIKKTNINLGNEHSHNSETKKVIYSYPQKDSYSSFRIKEQRLKLMYFIYVPVITSVFVLIGIYVANNIGSEISATTSIRGDVSTAEPGLVNNSNVLWVGTFDNPGDWKKNWAISHYGYSANTSIKKPSFAMDGNLLEFKVAGSADQSQKWGADIRTDFNGMGIGQKEEAYFRYYFYLPANFDCVDGGKLPGLSGITQGDKASSTPGGGNYSERGWSGRLYWHKDVDGKGCGLVSYMYVKHANGSNIKIKDGRYVGISPRWFFNANSSSWSNRMYIKKGQWNYIEVYYKMNTPGQNNGIHRGWLNGQLGIDLNDVQYRTSASPGLGINQIYSVIFVGGPLGPKTTQYLYFDNFAISKSYIGARSTVNISSGNGSAGGSSVDNGTTPNQVSESVSSTQTNGSSADAPEEVRSINGSTTNANIEPTDETAQNTENIEPLTSSQEQKTQSVAETVSTLITTGKIDKKSGLNLAKVSLIILSILTTIFVISYIAFIKLPFFEGLRSNIRYSRGKRG